IRDQVNTADGTITPEPHPSNPGNPGDSGNPVTLPSPPIVVPQALLPGGWLSGNTPFVSLNQAVHIEQKEGQTTIRLDPDAVLPLIQRSTSSSPIFAFGAAVSGSAAFEIPSAAAAAAWERGASSGSMLVLTSAGSYSLPLSVIKNNGGMEDGAVTKITLAPSELPETVSEAARNQQITLFPVPAMSYTVIVSHAGDTRTIEDFGDIYIERSMRIGAKDKWYPRPPIQPEIVPGIFRYDEHSGSFSFAPARFVTDDAGDVHAIIRRSGNSTYVAGYKQQLYVDEVPLWAEDAAGKMAALGILTGIMDNRFLPDAPVTRAEFAALLVRALGLQDKNAPSADGDVQESSRYSREIRIAEQAGLLTGLGGGLRPNEGLKREEMAVIAANAFQYVQRRKGAEEIDLALYNDADDISDWALESMRISVANGLIIGDPEMNLDPRGYSTRAQAVSVLERLLRKLSLID
ncbi:S-layer homology domain-containing protein, partial [Cohnella caldifontis]|uniref:S-layer homology domain-containing protein n=1 Tax=Cohnella caldifontis TaxID=3027471 RepID=UPI0023EA7B91